MTKSIAEILMTRDGLSKEEAEEMVDSARDELLDLLDAGDILAAEDICGDWFGLEPDYLEELMPI